MDVWYSPWHESDVFQGLRRSLPPSGCRRFGRHQVRNPVFWRADKLKNSQDSMLKIVCTRYQIFPISGRLYTFGCSRSRRHTSFASHMYQVVVDGAITLCSLLDQLIGDLSHKITKALAFFPIWVISIKTRSPWTATQRYNYIRS